MSDRKTPIQVIEKRRFLRLDDYFKVSFQPATEFGDLETAEPVEVGYSKNVSLGGVAFVTDFEVEDGAYIRASIVIPELDEPVDVVGQVVRTIPMEGGQREVAVKFLPFGIDEDQRSRLELFIYDHFLEDPNE